MFLRVLSHSPAIISPTAPLLWKATKLNNWLCSWGWEAKSSQRQNVAKNSLSYAWCLQFRKTRCNKMIWEKRCSWLEPESGGRVRKKSSSPQSHAIWDLPSTWLIRNASSLALPSAFIPLSNGVIDGWFAWLRFPLPALIEQRGRMADDLWYSSSHCFTSLLPLVWKMP